MIILIGNQKGGAGKSTLTLLLANYLTLIRKREVTILDMDYQQSLASKAEKARILDNEPLYEVLPTSLQHFISISQLLRKEPKRLILIDLPGKLDDDGLMDVFKAADLLICPFGYDEFSVESTVIFSMVVRKINTKVPIVFIPNRIKSLVKYETKTEVEKVLGSFGAITPPVTDRVDFQRITSLAIPLSVATVIVPIYDMLYEQYLMQEEEA